MEFYIHLIMPQHLQTGETSPYTGNTPTPHKIQKYFRDLHSGFFAESLQTSLHTGSLECGFKTTVKYEMRLKLECC
jgi:hypothetical protein